MGDNISCGNGIVVSCVAHLGECEAASLASTRMAPIVLVKLGLTRDFVSSRGRQEPFDANGANPHGSSLPADD